MDHKNEMDGPQQERHPATRGEVAVSLSERGVGEQFSTTRALKRALFELFFSYRTCKRRFGVFFLLPGGCKSGGKSLGKRLVVHNKGVVVLVKGRVMNTGNDTYMENDIFNQLWKL